MPISPEAARRRALVANAVLRGDKTAADEAKRDLRAQILQEHIEKVVDAAPPLTADQRQRLAQILTGGAA